MLETSHFLQKHELCFGTVRFCWTCAVRGRWQQRGFKGLSQWWTSVYFAAGNGTGASADYCNRPLVKQTKEKKKKAEEVRQEFWKRNGVDGFMIEKVLTLTFFFFPLAWVKRQIVASKILVLNLRFVLIFFN